MRCIGAAGLLVVHDDLWFMMVYACLPVLTRVFTWTAVGMYKNSRFVCCDSKEPNCSRDKGWDSIVRAGLSAKREGESVILIPVPKASVGRPFLRCSTSSLSPMSRDDYPECLSQRVVSVVSTCRF